MEDSKRVNASDRESVSDSEPLAHVEVRWYCNKSIRDWMVKILFRVFLGSFYDHGQNLHRSKGSGDAFIHYLEDELVGKIVCNREGHSLDHCLNVGIPEFETDKSEGIRDSIPWIHTCLIFRCL